MAPPDISSAVLSGGVGGFYRAVKGVLREEDFALPQVVVVGQEGSGKSSVLESLAMMPLIPRGRNLCTRMPIHLKFRRTPRSQTAQNVDPTMPEADRRIKMKLIYDDGRLPVVSSTDFTPDQASQLMQLWMEQIVQEESGAKKLKGVVSHVLEIEVSSSDVPNLTFVDLPHCCEP